MSRKAQAVLMHGKREAGDNSMLDAVGPKRSDLSIVGSEYDELSIDPRNANHAGPLIIYISVYANLCITLFH